MTLIIFVETFFIQSHSYSIRFEPLFEKANNLHMRKQRRRSAVK